MITEKIKALFNFIEFLHTNISNFKHYDGLIVQIQNLDEQRSSLNYRENYVDKLKYDKIQVELTQKFEIIHENITLPLYKKATDLEIGYLNTQRFWQWGLSEIHNLKEIFEEADIPEILLHKSKYIEFRESTQCNYFNDMFFHDLDRDLKELFQFFSISNNNEFETFEAKTIKVDTIKQLIEHITKKTDTRFWITLFADKKQNTIPEYASYKSQIEQNGCFRVTSYSDTVNIYTAELVILLTSQKLKCLNMESQEETEIKCFDYLKTYIEGYKEGKQYFEKEFNVSPNTLYGVNAEQYVKDIHLNFFHTNHTNAEEGWVYVKKKVPVIITHRTIKDFGFYSGIVSMVEAMVKKYPIQFETFDICEHQQQPQEIELAKPNKPKPTKIAEKWHALLYWIELSAKGQQPPKSIEGTFIKCEIEKIGKEKTGTTGQSFYREFIKIDLNNESLISKAFSKEWKNEIIKLSNNSQSVIDYIQSKYNSK